MDLFAFPGKAYRTEAPDEAVYEAAVFPVSNQKIWIVIQTGVYITAGFVIYLIFPAALRQADSYLIYLITPAFFFNAAPSATGYPRATAAHII